MMKGKKVLFIYRVMEDDPRHIGIIQKMHGQISALQENSMDVDNTTLSSQGILLNGQVYRKKNLKNKLARYGYYYKSYFADLWSIIQNGDYQVLYIRHFIATKSFIQFLKSVKTKSSAATILLEIPTYPYALEYRTFLQKIALKIDTKWKDQLKEYVDHIIHYGHDPEIWGIDCIRINNGIILPDEIHRPSTPADKMVFIGVGNLEYWWGLEDFISAFADHVMKFGNKLEIKIVGEGRMYNQLHSLVHDLKISKWVTFSGVKYGVELEKLLQQSHIGIGTLAMEKKGLMITSSLKHRMYASYGIPFVMSGTDDDFMDVPWVYRLKKGQKINIREILDWYKNITLEKSLTISIRNFAKSRLSWNTQFIPVVKAIKKL